jgi:putative ABC transport system ATP-binding protein
VLVNIKNINKSYKNQSLKLDILKNIEFEIEEQDFIALMGPSGSGKSTLLNLIAGLDKPDNGSIFFSNNDICKMNSKEIARFRRDYLGFVFQEYNLIDTLTASENIALALTMKKYNVNEIEEKINKIMRILSIDKLSNKLPYQLSCQCSDKSCLFQYVVKVCKISKVNISR